MRAYAALLRLPEARLFCLAALVGRMPISMLGIGSVLLVVDRRGSYALGGAVAAAYALGLAAGGPLVSRLVDRLGQRRVLPWSLAVSMAALLVVIAAAGTAAPAAVLLGAAIVTGAALPPLGACVRARWSCALRAAGRPEQVGGAFALESVVDEVVFIAGPAVVVALAVLLDPAAGLLAALALCTAGTVTFVGLRGTEPPVRPRSHGPTPSAVRVAGLRTTAAAMVFAGVVFGAMEVVMVAFADEQGRPAAAGFLLPLIAAGSAAAGLAYGARTWQASLDRRFLVALVGLTLGVVPLTLADGIASMAPAALLAGLAISPTLIASFGLVELLVPVSARTEGFTWLHSGLGVGVAAGSAAGGALAEAPGARAAFFVCVAGAALALGTAIAGRRTLVPASAPAAAA